MFHTALHLLERVRFATSIHLRPPRNLINSGLDVVPAPKLQDLFLEHPIVINCMRPGANY
jgi:hypothetical protein